MAQVYYQLKKKKMKIWIVSYSTSTPAKNQTHVYACEFEAIMKYNSIRFDTFDEFLDKHHDMSFSQSLELSDDELESMNVWFDGDNRISWEDVTENEYCILKIKESKLLAYE